MSTGTKVQGKVLNVTVFLMDIELTVIIASYGVTSIDMKLQQLLIWEYLIALATFPPPPRTPFPFSSPPILSPPTPTTPPTPELPRALPIPRTPPIPEIP